MEKKWIILLAMILIFVAFLVIIPSIFLNYFMNFGTSEESGGHYSDMGFSFDYPTTWKFKHESNLFRINSSNGINNNTTFYVDVLFTNDSLEKLVPIQKNLVLNPSNQIISEKNLTVDNSTAYEIDYTARTNITATYQERMVMIKKYSPTYKEDVLYFIWADRPEWNQTSIDDFDMVIKTFHIL